MDRSKSRTDLLAAGKKRLQQFRQKKDGKGGSSRGKSKKSDKNLIPEDDTDGQSSPSMSTTSSQVTDGNVETDNESNAVSAELLESQSSPNSLTLDNLDPSADSSPLAITNTIDEETELDSGRKSALAVQEGPEVDSELSSQDQGKRAQYVGADVAEDVSLRTSDEQKDLESDRRPGAEAQEVGKEDSELSFHEQGKNAQNVGAAVADDISLKTTDSLGPEGGPTYDHESAPAIVATAVGETVPVTAEGDSREVSLLLSEDTTITSLMQTREDKVTNLGAMQDADGLDTKKSGQSTDVEEAFHKTEQLGKSVEVVSSPKDIMPDKHLTSNQGQGDDIATGGPSVKNLEGEILSGSSHEEMHLQPIQEQIVEQVHSGHGRGLQEEPYQQSTPVGSIALDPNHELSMGDDAVNLARPVDASHSFDAKTVDFMKLAGIIKDLNEDVLAEIIRGLNEDEFYFLLKSRREVSDADPLATSSTLPDGDFSEAFQRLKEELFLSTLMKSISDMQLGEHLELQLQADNEHPQVIDEVSELRASHLEVNEKNQLLIEELSNCRAELQDVSQKCVELQNQFNDAKGVVETLSARVVELQISCEVSQEDSLNLSADLSDCRSLISCLQSEKKGMNENLELVSSEKIRLPNEKEVHLGESKRLSTELSDLKSSMEVIEVGNEVFDDSLGFVSLKTCLNGMEKILAKLEQATNEFHFQSVGRSGEQVSPAAASKTHEDEHEVEVRDSNEVHSSSESFIMFAKEETGNMRKLLSEWKGHVQSADALFKGERDGRKIGDAKNRDLKDQFEELKQHCSNLEASNVELTVQCEAAKQLLGDFQEKKCHLEELCEALKQEDIQLKAKNNELYEKLGQFQSKVSELYTEICDVKQSSNEMSSIIGDQLENLQKELTQRTMVLEQGWNTIMADIFKLVSKLNESVGETSSAVSFDAHDNLDINNLLAVSVNAATKMIFDLRKKLEATCLEHETICSSFKEVNMKCEDLLGRNELAVGVLHKIYNDLWKLLLSHSGSMGEEKIDVQSEALPDLLNYDSYQNIMRCLVDILTEKQELESVNNEMKSEMEELKIKCLDLDSVSKLIEDLAGALNIEHSQIERNKTPLSCLDSLVSSLLQKTRDAEIQLHMTKEGYGYSETELAELKDQMHYLDTLRLEKENEILVLKEILHQAEEALTAARSELHEKTNELEYSEQKVSSVREKLSIAVAKGKGLVVQRDGLKQSLAETSSELERCMQELQLKDARLHEVETKLKTYAEAGERMEAMESELSYIRNSSNSLRESFLLKDSMLQRIEEVLEELDLPEQFHSGDIIEKIDWLARSVASNSLPMNDWEQKESAGGVSYADAGYVARESLEDDSQLPPDSGDDSRKDDSQLQSDPGDVRQQQEELQASLVPLDGDDLRKKFEELHKKYFGLAEQNEMLEQSLMERNSIVQRWEELVDRIDMPSHLRSVEMEDRIEWVGRALAEANHHVDSLQLKIEKYESYCGLLNSDLEGSQRTVSALQTDLRSLTTEREHLSEKLEVLMFECEKLSMEVGQAEYQNEVMHNEISSLKDILEKKELENEKLHNELASLKDILEKKDSLEEQVFAIDSKLRKLHDLLGDALPESEMENLVSGTANIDSLEELLRKLIENQASLQSKKDAIEEQIFTIDSKLQKLHDLVRDVLPESETQNLVSGSANIDSLEELLRRLVENQASLKSKKDAIEEQIFTIDGKLRKLHDLVGDVLPESETENLVSGSLSIDSLEALLRKLIENQASLQSKKDAIEEQIFIIDGKLRKLHDLVGDALPESETENLVSGSLNIDSLEELLRRLMENQASLQSKKDAIEEQIFIIDGKLRTLHDLVGDALPESETENLVSGSANIDSLEELLRKLIENQASIQSEKGAIEEQIFTTDGKLRKLHDLIRDVLPESETQNLVSGSSNIDSLEELLRKLVENQASLQSKKDAIEEQIFTVDGKLKKLHDLVGDVLPESETENLVSGSANIDSLEELLRKLIENQASFRSKKDAIEEQIFTIDGKLQKLHDLVRDVLPESETQNLVSGSANIDSLEELLRKLVENQASLQSKKDAIEEQIFTIDGKLRKLHDLVGDVLPESETENLVSGSLSIDSLEALLRKLIENQASLQTKKDATEEQIFIIDGKLRKLLELVGDALPESETENLVSGSANIDSLEELLRKLVENQASLQSKKDAIEEQISTIDGKLKKLHDLVGDVLPESETENLVSGSANIDSLEELLRKLIENQASLQAKKDATEEQIFIIDGKLRKLHELVGDALPESETENLVSGSANIDSLEELLRKLIENQASIQSEKGAIEEQIFTTNGKLRKLHDLVFDVLPEYETENLVSGSANIDTLEELLRKLVESQASLQSKKDTIEEQIFTIDVKLRKLHDLVGDVLPESETENLVSGSANIDSLEELLRKLIENQASLQSNKLMHVVELASDSSQQDGATILEARSTDMHDKEEADIDRYKKDLEEALSELEHAKEEREKTLEKQMSLSIEVEALSKRIEELQLLLNQEEQKSASVREKLNVAVRKGKSLVQHRDSLKQTIEEMTTEITQLKSEISNREDTLAEHAQKLSHLSTYPNRLEALESEIIHLKNHLAESEHHLQEKEYSLNLILNKLGEIEIGGEGYISDPIKKLECIEKLCSDLHGTVASLEQESRKSKRAAELLLAELNEVQERNDAFQEELAKADAELVDLRKERDSFEAAKLEALSHLQKLSALHEEGKKNHSSELTALKSSMNELCTGFGEIQHLLVSAFSMDLESFQNLEAGLKSCIKGSNATNMLDSSVAKTHNGMSPWSSITKSSLSSDSRSDFDTVGNFHLLRSQLQEVLVEIGSLKERITIHSSLMLEQDKNLSELMASIEKEMTIQRESCEAMKQKVTNQDGELVALRGSIDYLCEACISSVNEIENGKAELVGNKVESDPGINLMLTSFGDGTSEERIRTLVDRLLMAAKSVATIRTGFSDANHNEMKATITNLQLELQEKDVQRERICSELVKQIKDAEASANSYSQDLQSLKIQEHNLKKQVEVIEAERKILEERVNELQEKQRIAAELEEKTKSQTDLLAAKDQEIESLMHALDEEEMQMEELTNKIVELEKVVQQKTREIESLDSSRGKVMKKLAVTVGKFDELHHLSASLLSEVERLQSQLQERDSEISFLRQEVTRCTNDVLLATQMSNKAGSDEIFELLMWVDTMISQEGMDDILPDLKSNSQVHEYKEILQKKLMSVLSELENLKAVAENKDAMLQEEKSKVEKLNHKAETLEKSLHEKEMQLNLLEGVEENGKGASTSSEILEVEPVVNEWRTTGPFVTPQVRSLRKGNNDYVAIAVDEDPVSTSRIEDEEDDKVHGFKSLSSSKIVPRFTRPVTDLIDGLWVSCDRTLMRRPILRLGIIIYWAIVHALLAFFVV
ncbi:uncharacterized protein [Arachis hypogaea]|uniref:Uncharacterized protein n=1 Tax=Arachis hypogaea TaxID=3818 RepID=A0A445CVU1_ARAHY|nr:centrosome-associated protein CEP250 isoform X2 [Arachis hypogaea]RYR55048.1 hypothetical protein Ahy_A06g030304 [Arachis hypogaea]